MWQSKRTKYDILNEVHINDDASEMQNMDSFLFLYNFMEDIKNQILKYQKRTANFKKGRRQQGEIGNQ